MRKLRLSLISYCIVIFLFLIQGSIFFISADNEQMNTIKIYSDASDGFSKFLGTSMVHSWQDVRDNETGNQAYDDWDNYLKGILAAYNGKNGDLYVISRSFFTFDTSLLTNTTIITNASLFLYGCGTNESRVCIVEWTDGSDGVSFDDYSMIGSTSFGISKSWSIDSYNEILLNNDGINAINISGLTYLACREYDHDFLDVVPLGEKLAEYRNGHYFSEEEGTDKDPYLLITYTAQGNDQGATPTSTPSVSVGMFILCGIIIIYIIIGKRED